MTNWNKYVKQFIPSGNKVVVQKVKKSSLENNKKEKTKDSEKEDDLEESIEDSEKEDDLEESK